MELPQQFSWRIELQKIKGKVEKKKNPRMKKLIFIYISVLYNTTISSYLCFHQHYVVLAKIVLHYRYMKQVTEFEGCYFLHVAYRISCLLLHNITLNYTNSRVKTTHWKQIFCYYFFSFSQPIHEIISTEELLGKFFCYIRWKVEFVSNEIFHTFQRV